MPGTRLGKALRAGFVSLGSCFGTHAFAAVAGHAVPGQIGFQEAVTPIATEIHHFHDYLILPIIVAICLFVAALLLICVFRFNETVHPVPSKTTHHTGLEVAWTIIPVLLLVVIAIPSFRLLTHQLVIPKADLTIKATGKQWYWSYDYPKDQNGGFGFDSVLKQDADLKPGDIHLLSVDNEVVVPVNKVVRVQVTGADVIHSWVVQSLGSRIDAVPGRLNETWFKAEREGIYYGQCSKLCGKDHAYMPIAVRVVSAPDYDAWLQSAKTKFADSRPAVTRLADAAPLHP
ncbi:cytochrome c oxidase subunit II [Lichenihabitans sp. Uapishka_5]|uniref:cytochrome c oxidase subunit II n=1 Tax=Lichenihabitans sp. Uapishka_5 TaxID=3037302 RepID=UPI0029E8129E|nr:cytochrome c oxidase subunit II [Lichenihabitans sp. Uapishka_5]MDX7949763.1 cytochrome c oxidase subunit II [Lichenihabitans sp. Uapishka_5]